MILRLPKLLLRVKYNGRLLALFMTLIAMALCGIYFVQYQRQADMRLCFQEKDQFDNKLTLSGVISLPNILKSEPQPTSGRNIFFHETSCHASGQYILELTARQACAIESAALHNPNFQVFALFAGPTYSNKTRQPLIEAILSYKNVQLRQLNLWSYAAGTPVEKWLNDGKLFRSRYLFSHISDFLRYLTLYRYGGIYLDMDIVMLRSMEEVPPNYAGAESNSDLAAGVMSLAPDGFGHAIAELCLRDFEQNFDGSNWGNNGPGVITRVAQKICGTKNITLMQKDHKRCLGFHVYERNAFYAVPWRQWRHFFEPDQLAETMAITKDSFVIHVWNKHSKQQLVKVGSDVVYGKYAEQHCPKSYAAAGEYF